MPLTVARRAAAPPSEELVQALLGDARSAVLLVGPKGRIHAANAAAERLLGVRLAALRRADAASVLRTTVAGDEPLRDARRQARTEREIVLVTAHGGDVPVLLRTYGLARGQWVLVTLEDLTQLRRMQQELRRHERLATLGQLSAGVAHEIRNPLAGIGTSAQVLLRRFEPRDERARFVRVILEEVARLDRIVTSLLQYARPRTPELRAGRLADCVERVLALSTETIAQGGVEVEVHVAPRLPDVYIDADLVTQVLLNVTLNAVQAMPDGGTLRYEVGRVRRRRPQRGPGRRAADVPRAGGRRGGGGSAWIEHQQVRVLDTGVGIPRGLLPKLFDPFFSTKPTGTGLGLSVSQTIMHEHGGSIVVDSREGRGTTVLLNFPVEKRHGERRQLDALADGDDAPHRR